MPLEERTLDEPFEERCAVCGAELTQSEILAAREDGGPFLCSVHAVEELPPGDDDEVSGTGSVA
jgi:hypothetical protein